MTAALGPAGRARRGRLACCAKRGAVPRDPRLGLLRYPEICSRNTSRVDVGTPAHAESNGARAPGGRSLRGNGNVRRVGRSIRGRFGPQGARDPASLIISARPGTLPTPGGIESHPHSPGTRGDGLKRIADNSQAGTGSGRRSGTVVFFIFVEAEVDSLMSSGTKRATSQFKRGVLREPAIVVSISTKRRPPPCCPVRR
jgi:hypothetical protein